jgi:oligo-alginate lyase
MKSTTPATSLALLLLLATFRCDGSETRSSNFAYVPFAAEIVERIPAASHPVVACTPDELQRLRRAHAGRDSAHKAVAAVVESASRRIARPVEFPPRGGQHNTWYQCNDCQIALKTLSPTRHECGRCNTVYSGPPYDDVLFSQTHRRNLDDMTDAAWAFALTGERKYAAFVREVLLGYAQRYRSYPYHDSRLRTGRGASPSGGHLFEQTLNEAMVMSRNIAIAYDLIRSSDVLTAAEHMSVRDELVRPMLENIVKHRGGKSNWQSWHNAAMIAGGAVLGDAGWVRRAIEDPENGFLYQMQVSVSEEGMWYENSWGYHFYTLGALAATVETARRLGVDLWSHPVLKKMFVIPVAYAMPDGSLPRFGDDVNTSLARASRMFELAYHVYGDASLRAFLPATANWDSVKLGRDVGEHPPPAAAQGSALFPSAGHAILRTRGDAGLVAALTFGPYGGAHGHLDKLSFVLFGHGRELGVDPGRARSQAYRLPVHQHWYKATISHNAVVVDRAPQLPATGKLESYAATDTWAAVVARCDEGYPGVAHRRVLCVGPSYVLVYDHLDAQTERRFDWLYHARGTVARSAEARDDEPPGEEYPGWAYVENVRFGTTDDLVRVRFLDADVTTYLTAAAARGTEVRTGDGVGASILDRVPLAMLTRRGTTAHFAAVLEPVRDGGKPAVDRVEIDSTGGELRISVGRAGARDVFLLDPRGALRVVSGGAPVLEARPHAE